MTSPVLREKSSPSENRIFHPARHEKNRRFVSWEIKEVA